MICWIMCLRVVSFLFFVMCAFFVYSEYYVFFSCASWFPFFYLLLHLLVSLGLVCVLRCVVVL